MTLGEEPQELLSRFLKDLGSNRPDEHAVRLLRRFGSLPRVLQARWFSLWRAVGWNLASALVSTEPAARRRLRRLVEARPSLTDREAVERFLEECSALITRQIPLAIYVDGDLRVIRIESVQRHASPEGVVDVSCPVLRGIELGASGFFLVRAGESRADFPQGAATFRSLHEFADERSVPLIAQVIVGDGEVVFLPTVASPAPVPRPFF